MIKFSGGLLPEQSDSVAMEALQMTNTGPEPLESGKWFHLVSIPLKISPLLEYDYSIIGII